MSIFRHIPTLVAGLCTLSAQAEIVWLQDEHDFGAFQENTGIVTCVFSGINTGSEPLSLLNVRANCGCTTPVYSTAPALPGDTLRIKVGYNPSGRPGKFAKQIYATISDGQKHSFRIKGTVIGASNTIASRYPVHAGPARLSNSVIPFGKISKGRPAAQAVKIYNASQNPITPAIERIPKYMNAIIKPDTIPPGEQGIISFTLYSDMTSDWGLVSDSIVIRGDKFSESPVTLTPVMILEEDFSSLTPEQIENAPKPTLSTDMVDIGRIRTDESVLKRTFTIANSGHMPMLIRSISTPDPAITVKVSSSTIKPGKKATVTLTINPAVAARHDMLNARITIITNSPTRPTEIVRVVGEIDRP